MIPITTVRGPCEFLFYVTGQFISREQGNKVGNPLEGPIYAKWMKHADIKKVQIQIIFLNRPVHAVHDNSRLLSPANSMDPDQTASLLNSLTRVRTIVFASVIN